MAKQDTNRYLHPAHDHVITPSGYVEGEPQFDSKSLSPKTCGRGCFDRGVSLVGSDTYEQAIGAVSKGTHEVVSSPTAMLHGVTVFRGKQAAPAQPNTPAQPSPEASSSESRKSGRPKGTTGIRQKEGNATGRKSGMRPMIYRGQETKYGQQMREYGDVLERKMQAKEAPEIAEAAKRFGTPSAKAPAKKAAAKKPTTRKSK